MISVMGKLIQIPQEILPTMIGSKIHLSWAKTGCVWVLDRIDGEKIYVHTPQTGRKYIYKAKDACYIRRNEPKVN